MAALPWPWHSDWHAIQLAVQFDVADAPNLYCQIKQIKLNTLKDFQWRIAATRQLIPETFMLWCTHMCGNFDDCCSKSPMRFLATELPEPPARAFLPNKSTIALLILRCAARNTWWINGCKRMQVAAFSLIHFHQEFNSNNFHAAKTPVRGDCPAPWHRPFPSRL